MSYSLVYYKDPGLLIDCAKLLSGNLNDSTVFNSALSHTLPTVEANLESKYIKSILTQFPMPPKELLLFFYIQNSKTPNLISDLLLTLCDQDFPNLTLSHFIQYLSNISVMKEKLFCFYFNHLPDSVGEAENLIRTSPLFPDKLKVYLLGFYIHPKPYLVQLISYIKQYYQRLTKDYYPHLPSTVLDSDALNYLFAHDYPEQLSELQSKPINYSYCCIMHRFLALNIIDSPYWIIAGSQLSYIVDILLPKHSYSSIETICSALGDPYRLRIVFYLHEQGQKNTFDILTHLGIAPSSLSHHLRVLKDAGIITAVKNESSFLYSLNRTAFQDAAETFTILKKGPSYENLETSCYNTLN